MYRLALAIVDRVNGDNNSDPGTNGELAFLWSNLRGADVVFDVGANIGRWAQMCLLLNPRIQLHCFEPSRFTFRNLERAGLPPSVRLNNCGLGAVRQPAQLRIYEEGSDLNSLYTRKGVTGKGWEDKSETVELVTLDGYCAENGVVRIDIMKLDVEGHELQVLKGAERLLAGGQIGLMQFEYGGCNIDAGVFLKDVFEFVTSVNPNARFYKVLPQQLVEVPGYDQQLETFRYANYVIGIARVPRGLQR
ncbi:MAG: FkbM family methyltransferase [Chloroflexi bacterium]|nr:FkbM family methyltransferase [Chloroflexota bacterium]